MKNQFTGETGRGVLVGSNEIVFQDVRIGAFSQIDELTQVRETLPNKKIVLCRAKGPVKRLDLPRGFLI